MKLTDIRLKYIVAWKLRACLYQRDALVVFFAGYQYRMDQFNDSNPGLSSRIAYHLDFLIIHQKNYVPLCQVPRSSVTLEAFLFVFRLEVYFYRIWKWRSAMCRISWDLSNAAVKNLRFRPWVQLVSIIGCAFVDGSTQTDKRVCKLQSNYCTRRKNTNIRDENFQVLD